MKCGWCGKPIITPVFVRVRGDVMLPTDLVGQKVFVSETQRDNYALQIPMHPPCWIELLKHCGAELKEEQQEEKPIENKDEEVNDGVG